MTPVPSSPLAITRPDGSLALLAPGAADVRIVATEGRWPAWRPGGTILAASRVHHGGEAPTSSIEVLDVSGSALGTAFASPPGVPHAIAPRVPHYVCWSPRGDVLSYVAVGREGLALFHQPFPIAQPAYQVAAGAPLFTAWHPAGRYHAIHAGTKMLIADTHDPGPPRVLSEASGGFRAPAYSGDGLVLAYATAATEGLRLVFANADGKEVRTVAHFTAGIAFSFRPGSHELAVGTAASPESGMFDGLWLLTAALERHLIHRGPFVAFSWRPDGGGLLVIVPTQAGDGRYTACLLAPGGERLATTEAFVPSDDFRAVLGFFDQYWQSHPAWAPDGSGIVISARLPLDGVSASWGDPQGPFAWHWPAAPGAPLQRLCPAAQAYFPPGA